MSRDFKITHADPKPIKHPDPDLSVVRKLNRTIRCSFCGRGVSHAGNRQIVACGEMLPFCDVCFGLPTDVLAFPESDLGINTKAIVTIAWQILERMQNGT
jgi:hypothetical protein